MKPEAILVATAFEAREPFVLGAWTLYRTLDAFGGPLRGAKRVAYSIGKLPSEVVDQFTSLDVLIRYAEPVQPGLPYANKLRVFEKPFADTQCLVALDSDIAVAGDISPWLGGRVFSAKPAEVDVLTLWQWKLVYEHFGLAMPQRRHLTHFQARETVPYFNSGVLIVPASLIDPIGYVWRQYISVFSRFNIETGSCTVVHCSSPPVN